MKKLLFILLVISNVVFGQEQLYWSLFNTVSGGGGGAPCTRTGLLLQCTWEEANPFSLFYSPTQSCCAYSLINQTDTFEYGTHALRVNLFRTDPTVAASKRAEVFPIVTDPINAERWYGASYYFPSATMVSDADYDLIGQWHPNTSNGSPPVGLRLLNGHWYVAIYTGNDIMGNPDNALFNWVDLGAYQMNKWNDVVIHYKQRSDPTGVTQIWINGVMVFNNTGINSYPGISNYFKCGLNKPPWMPGASWGGTQNHREFFIDEIRYGNETSNYCSVVPGNY